MHARCSEVCAEQPVLTSVLNCAQNNFIYNPAGDSVITSQLLVRKVQTEWQTL